MVSTVKRQRPQISFLLLSLLLFSLFAGHCLKQPCD